MTRRKPPELIEGDDALDRFSKALKSIFSIPPEGRGDGTMKTKKQRKRFVPTVKQYQEDLEVLRAAGPKAVLRSVLQPTATRARKPTKPAK